MANRNMEKMLSIANYQKNINQNHNELSTYLNQNGYSLKVYK